MANDEPEEIQALRQALSFSPENVALRQHLGARLMKLGRFSAAETEFRDALKIEANNSELNVLLAEAYFQQHKQSEALVVLESLERADRLTAQGKLLYARVLAQTTELVKAAKVYRDLLADHPNMQDESLDEELSPFLLEDSEDDADGPMRVPAGDIPGAGYLEKEAPDMTFDHVGGMDEVKDQIRMKVIHPLANADLFKAYGKSVGGGILLYGPPGCGKTLLARATAGEVKASFMAVGLHDVLDMWIGQSEKNLHEIFASARIHTPSVLFFDEVDALGASRSDLKQSAGRNTINQFLSELDGVDSNNDGLLILAATNAPWHLDSAFRRPGRFDRIIFVPPPDLPARAAILQVMLRDKPADRIDFEAVAKKTDGYSGADLKGLVDDAIEAKLEEAMKRGDLVPLTTKDLLKSAKRIKPSTREWFATAKNYALYANQSGLYDDILEHLKLKR
ncbi:AAA family ATPase [Cerasicoccus fimbriatus]|uniref:AAA family ATPase n=1 Tax=Cerasicoccus fimbriatus TaxID=3014554 RepID=UPI0022B32EFB|nr:AAA family ATPase [Cerasicoccus sp. TK19100]